MTNETYHGNDILLGRYEDAFFPGEDVLSEIEMHTIENKILEKIGQKQEDVESKPIMRRRKKRMFVVLVAAIVAAIGLTAGAATQNDWDIALMNLMGISDADSIQLEGGKVEIAIDASCSGIDYADNPAGEQKTINVTKITSIGDKNNAYIRIDTDYDVPADFNETTDYILPDDTDISIQKNARGDFNPSGWGSMFTSVYDNGKLSFVFNITGCENLNRSYVVVDVSNLYLHHDKEDGDEQLEENLIFAGSLHLEWKYSYRANAKTTRMLKRLDADGTQIMVDKVTVTPLDIHIHGYSVESVEGGNSSLDLLRIDAITFKDGTTIVPEGVSQGGIGDRHELDTHTNIEQIGQGLDVDNIESITVHGEVIKIR